MMTHGDDAPYVAHSETSRAAAESIDAAVLRCRVYLSISDAGADGMTCDEVEAHLAMRHQTASARIRELVLKGYVRASEKCRRTRSGRAATVWEVIRR